MSAEKTNITNYQELKNQLAIVDNGVIIQKDLSDTITQLTTDCYDSQAIVITEAKSGPGDGENEKVVIQGVSNFLNRTNLPLVATFYIDDQQKVQVLIEYTLVGDTRTPTSWSFSSSFPDLPTVNGFQSKLNPKPTSPLDELIFINSSLVVTTEAQKSTTPNVDLAYGINFIGKMKPTNILGILENTIGNSQLLTVSGTITLPKATEVTVPLLTLQYPWDLEKPSPGISLKIDLDINLYMSSMTFNQASFLIYSPTSTDWQIKNPSFEPITAYSGMLDVPSAEITVKISGIMEPGETEMLLRGDFKGVTVKKLASMVGIAGTDNLIGSMPDDIKKAGDVLGKLELESTSILLSLNSGKIKVLGAYFTIGIPELNWSIWEDHFTVDSISCGFSIRNPLTNPNVSVIISGQVDIEGVKVDIGASTLDGFTVYARTADKLTIPLKQLVSTYAPSIPAPSDLTIDKLQLGVSPKKRYSFALAMAGKPNEWTIPIGTTGFTVGDVVMNFRYLSGGSISGSVGGAIALGDIATISVAYDIPGDVIIRGDFPSVSLSEIVSILLQKKIEVPNGFDLTFTQSYIILQKKQSDYKMELGTVIDDIGSLAFVLQKGDTGWGFAAGLQIELDQLSKLTGGVGNGVKAFTSWFPFQNFTLAISTLKDQSFTFPGFKQFNQKSLGNSKIALPAIAQGIQPGFYLYTSTVFTKKNKILGALIDLLKIPEGTQLDGFVAYLTQKQQFQLGVSLTTFLTPVSDVSQRTCSGDLGYKNGCISGTIMVIAGGSDGFAFSLMATLKTIIEETNLEFDVVLTVVENGVFASGSLKTSKPIAFGPLQVGDLALELGISFEGIPSFGFAGELMVDDLFDSTLAVMVNTSNPAESMIAGALSNLTMGDVVDKMVGVVDEDIPQPIKKVLDEVAIGGSKDGAFQVPKGSPSTTLVDALNNFKGEVIQSNFTNYGKLSSFPSSSEGMMIFNDSDNGKWYITEKSGSGSNSTVTHWQLSQVSTDSAVSVSKEAQFYFVPSPTGVNIGTFFYPQGMKISGQIQFLMFKVDVDIDIEINKGIKVDAEMDKISFISDNLFSITAEEGGGGPQVSISTFAQPSAPPKFQKPHFYINGKMTMLGASSGVFVDINESGANFEISGSSLGGIFKGDLSGNFSAERMNIDGDISVGIPPINLGKLGKWDINKGVYASANVYADIQKGDFGAFFTAGFELAGSKHSLGIISLNVNVDKLSDLTSKFFEAVKEFLKKVFTDPKYWAEMAAKVLGWVEDEIEGVLTNVFGLSFDEAKKILSAISAFCPIVTAVNLLG
ncbi:hypothetical protein [Marinifilum flexuosum]|uniref:hypothetical protein n=1 Tax=Marinifilum flexuosum TaxID=1117708 RepID=UPI002494DB0D|nr:hypothetical protein [Marinifilum flexuosum]